MPFQTISFYANVVTDGFLPLSDCEKVRLIYSRMYNLTFKGLKEFKNLGAWQSKRTTAFWIVPGTFYSHYARQDL